ncbi:MAG: cytochrome c biogenesis protein CcsA [Planctomycetia bacterium]|nr:cytochrome c biogenesis protein CcsA [Planctomycetia bacterium]
MKRGLMMLLLLLGSMTAWGETWDFTAWETLPVFYQGRVMPLDAFARLEVLQVCGRENPRVEGRKYRPAEILFSWMVEPAKWENVPFLPLENEALRKQMGLPVFDAGGRRLAKVSPDDAVKFFTSETYAHFADTMEKARQTTGDYPAEYREQVEAVKQLESQLLTFRALTFDPRTAGGNRTAYLERFTSVMQLWSMQLAPKVTRIPLVDAAEVESLSQGVREIGQWMWENEKSPEKVTLSLLEERTYRLADAAAVLSEQVAHYAARLANTSRPERITEEEWQHLQNQTRVLSLQMKKLSLGTKELVEAIYQDGATLYVLPSLEAAPLDAWRDESVETHPWRSLNQLVYGRADAGFPAGVQPLLERSRQAFEKMSRSWKEDNAAGFTVASQTLKTTFGEIAKKTASRRETLLPEERRDAEILNATAYPTLAVQQRLDAEVFYYRLSPFLWAWVLPFVATVFLLFAGLFPQSLVTLRKVLEAVGLLLLSGGILFNTAGLLLRAWIMGRAPVTNMFETIVFVSWTAGVMGLWLALRSVLHAPLSYGWRATRIGSASGPADDVDTQTISWCLLPARMLLAGAVFWVLTLAGFGLGEGYSVLSLTPRVAVGGVWPSLSDWTVWLSGIFVLGILVVIVPRVLLAPVAALCVLPKLPRRTGGDSQRVWFALATAIVVFVISYTAWACTSMFNANLRNLMPILRDNYWLSVHVITIVASYGAGMLAWILADFSLLVSLFGRYPIVEGRPSPPAICRTLSELIYRCMQVAVLLLVVGTILGGLWADVSWGRFWSWDRKEVWALISLFVYLLILHGRYVRLLGEFTLSVGAICGALTILMAWYGVNYVIGSSLHGYGAGTGSLAGFLGISGIHLLLTTFAVTRYVWETRRQSVRT